MKAVILAGGYATRLKSVTNNGEIAKPLLPISAEGKNQPILYFLLDKIRALGKPIDETIIVTNNKYYNQISTACKDYKLLRHITVLSDGSNSPENMRGANGTLKLVNDYLINSSCEDILVIAGDNYFDFDLKDLIKFYKTKTSQNHSKYGVNVVVSKVFPESEKANIASKFGILNVDGNKVLGLDEKPGIENIKSTNVCLAVYLFNRADFDLIDNFLTLNRFDSKKRDNLGHFINYIIANSNTYAFQFTSNFIDIGTPEDYYRVAQNLSANNKNSISS